MRSFTCENCQHTGPAAITCKCEKVAADLAERGDYVASHLVKALLARLKALRGPGGSAAHVAELLGMDPQLEPFWIDQALTRRRELIRLGWVALQRWVVEERQKRALERADPENKNRHIGRTYSDGTAHAWRVMDVSTGRRGDVARLQSRERAGKARNVPVARLEREYKEVSSA